MAIVDDIIGDAEIGPLWSKHFPRIADDVVSKTLVLALVYLVEDKAKAAATDSDWSERVPQELTTLRYSFGAVLADLQRGVEVDSVLRSRCEKTNVIGTRDPYWQIFRAILRDSVLYLVNGPHDTAAHRIWDRFTARVFRVRNAQDHVALSGAARSTHSLRDYSWWPNACVDAKGRLPAAFGAGNIEVDFDRLL